MTETETQKVSHPEFAGKNVIFNSHGQVCSVKEATKKVEFDYAITPFPEINFLLEVLSASDNLNCPFF